MYIAGLPSFTKPEVVFTRCKIKEFMQKAITDVAYMRLCLKYR
jgi:hypothetical protein